MTQKAKTIDGPQPAPAPGAEPSSARAEDAPLRRFGVGLSRRYVMVSRVTVGLSYPFWHLLAPDGAADPWFVWWVIGAIFVAVGLMAAVPGVPDRLLHRLFHFCPWLVTAHLFLLAHVNEMQPFFAVGSALALLSTATQLRTLPSLVAYGVFATTLGGTLYLLEPDPRKLAYWIGLLPVLVLAWHRLSVQIDAADAVEHQQEELERRVRERTAELTRAYEQLQRELEERELLQEQLRLSQKMQAVGRLAGGIAHDFNNLLTVIGSYGEFVLAKSEDPATRRDVSEMLRAGDKAAQLTSRLLAFARGGVTQPVMVDLNEIVSDSAGMIGSVTGEDIDASVVLAERILCIRADRDQLDQVLLNLVLNARDAMPDGGKLTIATRNHGPDDPETAGLGPHGPVEGWAVLSVRDTGVGMDPETQSRAFEPFFTTKPADRGTGLGLAMVYGTVQQAGGQVRLTSEPGQGTCFELWFPAFRSEATVSRKAARRTLPSAGGQCVLVVEDDPDIRQITRRALRDAGYVVLDAEDGDVALVVLEETRLSVELVLTDVVMPHMSGFELAERIAERRPELPVIFMSGHLNHPSLRERELPPDISLLSKPFTPADLLEHVGLALAEARSRTD
ncbi:MAG: response regulator [Myxococcales bacterium]|nr:response regulator [Myxococcales bacterium]